MKKPIKNIILAIVIGAVAFIGVAAAFAAVPAEAAPEKTENHIAASSRAAYLVDYDTGTVLYERNPDAKYPIASMVKIMTLVITFENIEKGRLSYDQMICVSSNAAGMGGSQMFLDANKEYSVSDLIKGVVVVSANDASVALAETICGSKEAFVGLMNEKAAELGMKDTAFVNVTGLPESGQYSTARDVTRMMRELLRHKEYYKYSTIYMENYSHPDGRVSELVNTNKLIRFYKGCDAGKTGFTNDAMFCLSASAVRDGTRVIATVLGADNTKARSSEITGLFNYAFANYKSVKIVEQGKAISNSATAKRSDDPIVAAPDKTISILVKKGAKPDLDVVFTPVENLKAPLAKGTVIGKITVTDKTSGKEIDSANVVLLEDVNARTYGESISNVLKNWYFGSSR